MEKRFLLNPYEIIKRIVNFEEQLYSYKKHLRRIYGFLIGTTIFLLVSFTGFIIDAWKFHGEKTEEYQQTIKELKDSFQQQIDSKQNREIRELRELVKDLKQLKNS